ncbi:MAG: hypothetical protein ACPG5W_01410, partial [Flavobacteriales bacterium]
TQQIELNADTIQLDTLSVVPSSFVLNSFDGKIDTTKYELEWYSGKLIIDPSLKGTSATANYRVFPSLYSKRSFNKDPSLIRNIRQIPRNPFSYTVRKGSADQLFDLGTLSKSGSISRGVTIGNNQDLGVTSSLNLNLSGQLTPKIGIRAAITDNNIPFQPEGNTQQLQDFDQIYIQLYTDQTELTAGDFRLQRPNSYFMNFFKRAQGLSIKHRFPIVRKKITDEHPGFLEVKGSGALSRGKFNRQPIDGQEGNQGPYRLKGAENESFIIVIAGTERIYIDGLLMTRGQENDYTIDYNTAELTFTTKRLITKDSRIIAEFQYSERNYSRSLFHVGTNFEKNRVKVRFNLYSEQDGKNNLLDVDLNGAQLDLLQDIGDSLDLAVISAVDSVGFEDDQIRYWRTDTTVNVGGLPANFPEIFVYSTDPDSAVYQVRFSNVGVGNGDYNQVPTGANGRVYEWVAPDSITGAHQGEYVPLQQIVTPKMNQLYTLGAEYKVGKNGTVAVEGALSNTDVNRFSTKDSDDNLGYGVKVKYDHLIPLGDSGKWAIKTGVDFEHLDENFRPIERFRTVEFERDWNLQNKNTFTNQYISTAKLGFIRKDIADVEYSFRSFLNETQFEAYQNALVAKVIHKGFNFDFNGSHIFSNGQEVNNRFGRFQAGVQHKFKWFTVGGKDIFEDNRFFNTQTDSLQQLTSYNWNDAKVYIKSPDTWKNRYSVFYQRRDDWLPSNNELKYSSLGESFGISGELAKNPKSVFKSTVTYRRLVIKDTLLSNNKPDNTLVIRLEYNLKLFKGAITSSTFYEVGSGLESKKDFIYLEVPSGQGAYSWIDQNGDGIKTLDEYVQAVYQDTAKYIRVFTPTNDFTKVYTTQFNEVFNLNPRVVWGGKTGIKKFVSRFSNQLVYRIDRKTQRANFLEAFNPFYTSLTIGDSIPDTTLVTLTSSLRNTFFFNRSSSKVGADYTYAQNNSKVYLANGFETRRNNYHKLKVRWNLAKILTLNALGEYGWKSANSDFFSTNQFNIRYYEIEPQLVIQPGTKWRIRGKFKYTDKLNSIADTTLTQQAILRDAGIDGKYNILQRGSINATFNFISITYDGTTGNTVEFELLEGLKAGLNYTWSAFFQMRIGKNMQVNLQYSGRKSENARSVHTGTVQVRAFF